MNADPIALPTLTNWRHELSALRDALARQLLGRPPDREMPLEVSDGDGGYGAPAWLEGDALHVDIETAAALDGPPAAPEFRHAVEALAHVLAHSIGSGPRFAELAEQLLEEACAETIAQTFADDFAAAFGLPPAPRMPSCVVPVERLARLAERTAMRPVALAIKLKAMPGAKRFAALVAQVAATGAEERARAYLGKLDGFEGKQGRVEAVTLMPGLDSATVVKALASVEGETLAAVRRGLDAMMMLWTARTVASLHGRG